MSRLTKMCDDKSGYFMKNECPKIDEYGKTWALTKEELKCQK